MGTESDKQQKRAIQDRMIGKARGVGTERQIGVQVGHFPGAISQLSPTLSGLFWMEI